MQLVNPVEDPVFFFDVLVLADSDNVSCQAYPHFFPVVNRAKESQVVFFP